MRLAKESHDRRKLGDGFGLRRSLLALMVLALLGCTVRELPEEEKNGSARAGAPGPAEAVISPEDSARVADEVVAMLQASSESWNAGDLDGFLDDYWPSESLTFSGASGVTRGWEGVRERYQERYWAPGTQRDSLRFEGLEVMPLGSAHALALGQYVLYRPEEDGRVSSTGFFSLVLRRVGGEWKIIHDHTSATPPS